MKLGHLTIEEFLQDYWQKKPVLIRQAFPQPPVVSPDILAGYALEEEVESRLILERPENDRLYSKWDMHQGPFQEKTFAKLPESHWTLLVQAVNQLDPAIHNLLQRFRFIPNWRLDDVMISYASDQGGVGPHFDYYDVFLLQASGKRLWKIGQECSTESPLRQDTDCKILTQFETQEEWLVEPGDLLYIPPRIAHWGIAQGECLTYSIGFRAPSYSEMLLDFSQDVAGYYSQDERFNDGDRNPVENPGLIEKADLAKVRKILETMLLDEDRLADWFGRYMTIPQRNWIQFEPENQDPALTPGVRAAYRPTSDAQAVLYIQGEQHPCSTELAKHLCAHKGVSDKQTWSDEDKSLIEYLIEEGYLQ